MLQQSENFFQDEEEEHFVDADVDQVEEEVKVKEDVHYDPFKRDPKYCRAETTSLWELHSFLKSFHPKVGTPIYDND